jgi:alkylation response protein AidB-like acyl-CoA dehydrogenase
VESIAKQWREQRAERQVRRHLERDDFDVLAEAGFLRLVVPEQFGGAWRSLEASTRPIATALRTLGRADPSVALVASMHPAVLGYWLCTTDDSQPAWVEQRRGVFESAASGAQWGTITSEPGSGGDILKTRTRAEKTTAPHPEIPGECYRLSGDKHFGSGFGISSYMMTTAVADGGTEPTVFVIDMRDRLDGRADDLRVTAEWDGAGMAATQSHAARLEGTPAVRLAWDGPIDALVANAGPLAMVLFTAVLLGVFDEATASARASLTPKREQLRAFEQVEWSRADLDHWLAVQAYEGALRAIEEGDPMARLHATLRAKTAVAELAEQGLRRIGQVLGGGTFSRRSPQSAWFEDVRALGFLRPPWGLAFDNLFATAFEPGE